MDSLPVLNQRRMQGSIGPSINISDSVSDEKLDRLVPESDLENQIEYERIINALDPSRDIEPFYPQSLYMRLPFSTQYLINAVERAPLCRLICSRLATPNHVYDENMPVYTWLVSCANNLGYEKFNSQISWALTHEGEMDLDVVDFCERDDEGWLALNVPFCMAKMHDWKHSPNGLGEYEGYFLWDNLKNYKLLLEQMNFSMRVHGWNVVDRQYMHKLGIAVALHGSRKQIEDIISEERETCPAITSCIMPYLEKSLMRGVSRVQPEDQDAEVVVEILLDLCIAFTRGETLEKLERWIHAGNPTSKIIFNQFDKLLRNEQGQESL